MDEKEKREIELDLTKSIEKLGEQARNEIERREMLKPDKEKLNDWIEILENENIPGTENPEVKKLRNGICVKLQDVFDWAYKEIDKL